MKYQLGSQAQPAPAFGSSAFGGGSSFGGAAAPAGGSGSGGLFGSAAPAGAFGAPANASFGAPSGVSAFGSFGAPAATAAPAFGAAATPAAQPATLSFGTSFGSSAFGAPANPQPSAGFASNPHPGHHPHQPSGQPSTSSLFGQSALAPASAPAPAFGSFSAAPSAPAPAFGSAQSAGAFGASTTGAFGSTAPKFGSAGSAGSAALGGFGATPSTANPPPANPPPTLFATQPAQGLFGGPAPAPAPPLAFNPQPASSSFSFGARPPAATPPLTTGFSFGAPPATNPPASASAAGSAPASTSGSAAQPAPAFTALSFTVPALTAPSTAQTAPASETAKPAFSFGGSTTAQAGSTSAAAPFSLGAPASLPPTESKPALSFKLPENPVARPSEAPPKPQEPSVVLPKPLVQTAAATTAANAAAAPPPPPATVPQTPVASTSTALTTSNPASASASTAAPIAMQNLPTSISFPSNLKNKTLEEIILSWNEELESLVSSFERQAVEVAQWDKKIIHNGEQIIALNDRVNKLEALQKEIDQSLTYVVTQQSELEGLLDGIEKEMPGLAQATSISRPGAVDLERDRLFDSAENAQGHVIDIANQLSKMIHEINNAATESSVPADGAGQPLVEIAQILNVHLDALQWIDHKVDELRQASTSVKSQASKAASDMERFTAASDGS